MIEIFLVEKEVVGDCPGAETLSMPQAMKETMKVRIRDSQKLLMIICD